MKKIPLEFNCIKEFIDFYPFCPFCKNNLSCNLESILGKTVNPSIIDDHFLIVNFKIFKLKINIHNNEFLFSSSYLFNKYNNYLNSYYLYFRIKCSPSCGFMVTSNFITFNELMSSINLESLVFYSSLQEQDDYLVIRNNYILNETNIHYKSFFKSIPIVNFDLFSPENMEQKLKIIKAFL